MPFTFGLGVLIFFESLIDIDINKQSTEQMNDAKIVEQTISKNFAFKMWSGFLYNGTPTYIILMSHESNYRWVLFKQTIRWSEWKKEVEDVEKKSN